MPDTTNTQALFAALRDDPCDWTRWMVYADALEEECGNYRVSTHAATDFRDAGRLMREMMSGDVASIDLLIEYRFAEYLLFQAFDAGRLSDLPENVWIAVQQLAAERDEAAFAYRHICGGDRFLHGDSTLTPKMVRFAATVGRKSGAYAVQFHPPYWLAARRTDGRIRTAIVGNYSGRGNALAWADAWKEGE